VGAIADVAKNLGLAVVGCAIGYPSEQNDKGKLPVWSPLHVTTAAKLRPLASSSRFVILCAVPEAVVGVSGDEGKKKKGVAASAAAAGGKKLRRKGGGTAAAVRSVMRGFSLEAFELSDQTATLLERQILPTSLLSAAGTPAAKTKTKAKASNKKRGKGKNKGGEEDQEGEKLVLNSPVIIANGVETREIDPLLLAVPMPIVAIGTGSVAPRKAKGGIVTAKTASSPPWRPAPLGITFEHSFPSARELHESPALLKRASRHVIEVLSKRPPMVARLRDVQLLLHLSSILDGATMGAMCESLAAPASAVLPQGVLMAMEMAKLSLQGGAEGETEEDEL
jgi:hypothetical protein